MRVVLHRHLEDGEQADEGLGLAVAPHVVLRVHGSFVADESDVALRFRGHCERGGGADVLVLSAFVLDSNELVRF